MSKAQIKIEELNENIDINTLLNSPIISKKIPYIQPSPLILNNNKNLPKDNFILGEEKEIENEDNSISIYDSDIEINSTDEDDSFDENNENLNIEVNKLSILDILKQNSNENFIIKKKQ